MDAALRAKPAYTPPASADFYSRVPVIGMHLNDTWGDCTCAGDANIVQGETFYGQGNEVVVPDAAVLTAYEASGFDPSQGPPGSNPTDNGWLIPDALTYLRDQGMAGHKIAAYGQVDKSDHSLVMQACAEFGYLSTGLNLPQSAEDQFNAGQPWDVVPDDGGILGGHCVVMCGYTPTGPVIWTWDKAQPVTWAFWDKYFDEAWPVVSNDWVSKATGKDPEGVDTATLGIEFQGVTGTNPFPVTPPDPTPVPTGSGCLPFARTVLRRWVQPRDLND